MTTAATHHAEGPFDVNITPTADEGTPGRMMLDKTYHGDMTGEATGQMLTAMTDVRGSAGYVAIERFEGTLHGKRGAFSLQHNGVMTRGEPSLTVTVVPDSATGELVGLRGTMGIDIREGGAHFYTLDYWFEAPPAQ